MEKSVMGTHTHSFFGLLVPLSCFSVLKSLRVGPQDCQSRVLTTGRVWVYMTCDCLSKFREEECGTKKSIPAISTQMTQLLQPKQPLPLLIGTCVGPGGSK